MDEDTTLHTPKAPLKLSKGKAAVAFGIVALLIGVTTVQNMRQQGQERAAVDAELAARADALLEYVAQQAPTPAGTQSATPGTAALPEYSVSAVDQRAEARNANLDLTINQLIGFVQETNCARVQQYLILARSASSEQGISQESWLLREFTRTVQEMEAHATNVGYAADAGAIAEYRSASQEPLAVAVALRHLYSGTVPTCRPDAFPSVTAARVTLQDAMVVLQMRREQIANDPTTVIPELSENTAIPVDPAQSVDVVNGGAQ